MFYIWWTDYAASLVLLICGLVRFPRYRRHQDWPEERQKYAAESFHRLVWQMGLLFGALSFMLMRSTKLMSTTWQFVLAGLILVLMAVAILWIDIPVTRAVQEKFEGDEA